MAPWGDTPRLPIMIDNRVSSVLEAVQDIPDGVHLAVGGFGLCGIHSPGHLRPPAGARHHL